MRNLWEQVKKTLCYQKLFWPFTVWINCSSDLKMVANSWPSASNFRSFSWSIELFFLTVGQNNFGNKIPFFVNAQAALKFLCNLDGHVYVVRFILSFIFIHDFTVNLNTMADFAKFHPEINLKQKSYEINKRNYSRYVDNFGLNFAIL